MTIMLQAIRTLPRHEILGSGLFYEKRGAILLKRGGSACTDGRPSFLRSVREQAILRSMIGGATQKVTPPHSLQNDLGFYVCNLSSVSSM